MRHPDAADAAFDAHAARGRDVDRAPLPAGADDAGGGGETWARGASRPANTTPEGALTTRRARITGPLAYRSGSGRMLNIPIGPCLVESLGGRSIDVIWGARGQSSVALPVEAIAAARAHGHLVLLD